LPACKKVNPLGTFSVDVDIRSTWNASCPTSVIAQFVKQQRWQATATRFEEDESDEESEAAYDD
jgi:hypothetical protein